MAASKECGDELCEKNFKCCVKQKVKVAVCVKCGNVFHRSCMERKNFLIIDDSRVICCEESAQNISNGLQDNNSENCIRILQCENQLLKKIIQEKEEKYAILVENKVLLEDKIGYLSVVDYSKTKQTDKNLGSVQKAVNKEAKTKEMYKIQNDKKGQLISVDIQGNQRICSSASGSDGIVFDDASSANVNFQKANGQGNTGNKTSTGNHSITKTEVSCAVMQAQTRNKMTEIINLENDSNEGARASSVENLMWTEVVKKSKQKVRIVGNNKNSTLVRGVPKYVDLHVSRVDPTNTIEDMYELLRLNFSEVKIESITPKYPSLYSSYKVSIYDSNFKKAMNPTFWPNGSCISRFFYKRQMLKKDP